VMDDEIKDDWYGYKIEHKIKHEYPVYVPLSLTNTFCLQFFHVPCCGGCQPAHS